jgi:DNA helicase-4
MTTTKSNAERAFLEAIKIPQISYERSFWAGLLTLTGRGSICLEDNTWRLKVGDEALLVSADDVAAVWVARGLIWSKIMVDANGRSFSFPGLPHTAAAHLRGVFQLRGLPESIADALSTWDGLVSRQRYMNHRSWAAWQQQHADTRLSVGEAQLRYLPQRGAQMASQFSSLHDDVQTEVAALNHQHLQRELSACKDFFDSVESNPLTQKQREALITDEDNTLVVAGAGTGKTSVVVGKVGYLVKRQRVPPHEILLLAYNRAAAKEMQTRVDERIGVDLKVSTFHALGLNIIGSAEGRKPSLSRLVEGTDGTATFIEGVLQKMLADAVLRIPLLRHLVEYLRPYKAPAEFANKNEFIGYLKSADIKTIRGEQVRSFEESVIADWLFVNGIAYEYEANYRHDLATATHRQYKPDFFLPESGVYIEHFGISRDGSTAPWVPTAEYHEGMRWKRGIHAQYKTTLIETFSYDRQEHALTERLGERLANAGVRPRPRSASEIEEALKNRKVFTVLAKLLTTFLRHFKEGRHTLTSLQSSPETGDKFRRGSFLNVFEHVRNAYEAELDREPAIDFQDMIGRAVDHVSAGRYKSPFRYIIVDEFQDMSGGRARLVDALISQADDPRLMCVGDDWQSIYRFAGSDISYMTEFEENFGYTVSVSLDRTFRFGERLLAASARFVQKNPAQIKKKIQGQRDEGSPAVIIVEMAARPYGDLPAAQQQVTDEIRAVLSQISRDHPGDGPISVFLLGRYNFSVPEHNMDKLCRGIDRIKAKFLSVHRSKGLQADYVVVLNMISGRYGFPSEISDDPLLGMVLARPDAMEHAEERRLFYVALTRAKRRVFVLSRETQRSPFVEELMKPEFRGLVQAPEGWAQPVICPECGGALTKRKNSRSEQTFWGCVNYPYCEGSTDVCSVCQEGAMVLEGSSYQCSEDRCSVREAVCPSCRKGRLVQRTNRQKGNQFWGCSRWSRDGNGCKYTKSG